MLQICMFSLFFFFLRNHFFAITSQATNNSDNRVQQPHQNTQWEEVTGRDSSKTSVPFRGKDNQRREPALLEIQPRYSWRAQIGVCTLAGIACTSPAGPEKRHFRCFYLKAPLITVNVLPSKTELPYLPHLFISGYLGCLHYWVRKSRLFFHSVHALSHQQAAEEKKGLEVWDLGGKRAPGGLG